MADTNVPTGSTKPMTTAERSARYRKRKKQQGLHEEYKAKARERMKKHCQNLLKMPPIVLKERGKSEAIKKRMQRRLANAATHRPTVSNDDYSCSQTLGKAVSRATSGSALPRPVKRAKVIAVLAKNCGLTLMSKNCIRKVNDVGPVAKAAVVAYYMSAEISWQSSNMKDRVIVRSKDEHDTVIKSYEPKRFLLMSLKEVYEFFKNQNPDITISFSTFYRLKPHCIASFCDIPSSVCLCKFHENFRCLLDEVRKHVPVNGENFSTFYENVTCDVSNKSCMLRQCTGYKLMFDGLDPRYHLNDPDKIIVKCEQWVTKNSRTCKEVMVWILSQCFKELKLQLTPFLRHVYVKRSQAENFTRTVDAVNGKNVVLQLDFSENFTFIEQFEIQSAHWSHPQCTVFTVHALTDRKKMRSFAIVSDELNHGKVAVYSFVNKILGEISDNIECINIFTDGAASQFKQKYLMSLLHIFEMRYSFKVIWNFFATSHGKGLVDGIGATIKGSVWRRMKTGDIVKTPQDFARVVSEKCGNVQIFFVPKSDIECHKDELNEHWALCKPISGIQGIHFIRPISSTFLEIKDTGDSETARYVQILSES